MQENLGKCLPRFETNYSVNEVMKSEAVKVFENPAYSGRSGKPTLSLLVAVYNNFNFFKLVFASIEIQTLKNFEVIICDDGSSEAAIVEFKTTYMNSKTPVKHIWHTDRGFTKNESLNRGVIASTSDYLVFIDGDCCLHPQFLEDHYQHRQAGKALSGRRVDLSDWVTKKLSPALIKAQYLQKNWLKIMLAIFLKKHSNGVKGIRIKSDFLFNKLNKKYRGLVGCNFSIFKSDLLKVNGFDMTYNRAGVGEDSDLEVRLKMIGILPQPLINRGIQYHLYHPLLPRTHGNETKLSEVMNSKKFFAQQGLAQLAEEASS